MHRNILPLVVYCGVTIYFLQLLNHYAKTSNHWISPRSSHPADGLSDGWSIDEPTAFISWAMMNWRPNNTHLLLSNDRVSNVLDPLPVLYLQRTPLNAGETDGRWDSRIYVRRNHPFYLLPDLSRWCCYIIWIAMINRIRSLRNLWYFQKVPIIWSFGDRRLFE